MNVIKIDDAACEGCKACYKACWLDVIRWNGESERPVIAYPEDCVECNFCGSELPEWSHLREHRLHSAVPQPVLPQACRQGAGDRTMAAMQKLGKVIETDLLVVGFGIAGLAAAIVAKEEAPGLRVLAVDKGCVGYAGKANKGGGHVAFIPEGGEEAYVEYHTRNCGDYLNDQDRLRTYAQSTIKTIDCWARWGVKFIGREHAGQAHPVIPWRICLVDSDMMVPMAHHAKALGSEFKEKVTITDILKEGDRVVGAFGFSLLTGQALVFKAKAVLLANGDQGFRIMRMWNSARGDGIAAAYRAGSEDAQRGIR